MCCIFQSVIFHEARCVPQSLHVQLLLSSCSRASGSPRLLLLLLSEAGCWHDGPTGSAETSATPSSVPLWEHWVGDSRCQRCRVELLQSRGTRSANARLYVVPHHTGDTLGPPSGPLNGSMIWTRCSDHSGSEQAGQHLCEIPTPYGLWGGWPSRRRRLPCVLDARVLNVAATGAAVVWSDVEWMIVWCRLVMITMKCVLVRSEVM